MSIYNELWLKTIKEKFDVNKPDFLDNCVPLGVTVVDENHFLNSSEAGADPAVVENNTSYPITAVERTDISHRTEMKKFDTISTVIRNLEAKQLSYNKRVSISQGHARALANSCGLEAAYVFSPDTDTAVTPVLETTGSDDGRGTTSKALTEEDVFKLSEKFVKLVGKDAPKTLCLTTSHLYDLMKTSEILKGQQIYQGAMGKVNIGLFSMHGFEIKVYDSGILYNAAGAKRNKGANPNPNSRPASFAFVNEEAEYGEGEIAIYSKIKDPGERGDVLGFNKWFGARTARLSGSFFGAIRSVAV